MFKDAFQVSSSFTRPVVISTRRLNGEVGSVVGSFIVLNAEGWILTAGHIVNPIDTHLSEVQANRQKLAERDAIQAGTEPDGFKRAMIKKLNLPKNALTHVSPWWGQDGAQLAGAIIDPLGDLAVGQLRNFDTTGIGFPKFKRLKLDSRAHQAMPLLKIGYPFASVATTFDDKQSTFNMDVGGLTMFPIDGVITRVIRIYDDKSQQQSALFIETSSPGLKGQSGGPTVDVQGVVWAVQSQTHTLDLDFIGQNGSAGDRVRQFLNVGLGAHPLGIEAILNQAGVVVEWVDE